MHRTLAALALAVSLLTTAPASVLDPLSAFFFSLWGASPAIDIGCGMDPNGCSTGS